MAPVQNPLENLEHTKRRAADRASVNDLNASAPSFIKKRLIAVAAKDVRPNRVIHAPFFFLSYAQYVQVLSFFVEGPENLIRQVVEPRS